MFPVGCSFVQPFRKPPLGGALVGVSQRQRGIGGSLCRPGACCLLGKIEQRSSQQSPVCRGESTLTIAITNIATMNCCCRSGSERLHVHTGKGQAMHASELWPTSQQPSQEAQPRPRQQSATGGQFLFLNSSFPDPAPASKCAH